MALPNEAYGDAEHDLNHNNVTSSHVIPWSGVGGWGNPTIQPGATAKTTFPAANEVRSLPPDHVQLVAPAHAFPRFGDLFNDPEFSMLEATEQRITMSNVDGEVLEAFLRFLYGLPARCPTDQLVPLCALADQYDVTALQDAAKGAVMTHAVYDAVLCCRSYLQAQQHGIRYLQGHCWRHLVANLGELLQEPEELGHLSLEDMHQLLTLSGQRVVPPARPLGSLAAAAAAAATTASSSAGGSKLKSASSPGPPSRVSIFSAPKFNSPFREVSELSLFMAAMAWVGAAAEERVQHLDDLLQRLHFERMSPSELAVVRADPVASRSVLLQEKLLQAGWDGSRAAMDSHA